jgi:hypothetical protein
VFSLTGLDTEQPKIELKIILRGHRYGISNIAVLDHNLLLTVGDQNDKGLLLWELTTPRLLSANLHKEIEILGVSQLSTSN